jgi:mannose-1-phosphate guanylyltransferase
MFLDSKGVMLFERGGRHSHEVMVTGSGPGERVWAIVLAGGQGTRLKPLVERIHADGRPKQYAVLMGRRSLLRHTLDRAALAIPPDRIVVVTTKSHAAYFGSEFSEPGPAKVLVQPHDRGTAAGILLPVHWIAWRDPGATVVILPSDHFVADEEAFMRHIASLFSVAERHPDRILLVGATPESPESGYGWIQPGIELEKGPSGDIRTVDRFVEKPSPAEARACLARGGVWNTFVMVARASALIEAGRLALPELHERLRRIRPYAGTSAEPSAIERAYALAPTANFSQSVLASSPGRLAVSRLPAVSWSDWGTPERVLETLHREGIAPAWLTGGAKATPVIPRRVSAEGSL